jgi:hypothetical protein
MKATLACRHRHYLSEDYGYTGPVSVNQNPAAHGNITRVDTCQACGAVRRTNINGGHTETSGWKRKEA